MINFNKQDNDKIFLMLLSKDMVTYGDEQRNKMQHLKHFEIDFEDAIETETGYLVNLNIVLDSIQDLIPRTDMWYELFITTKGARTYHYEKQAKNGFYHIETLNLPFHSFHFSYSKD